MKLGEVILPMHVYYNFTKFHQSRMKNKTKIINSPFHLFLNLPIFANSLLNDPAHRIAIMASYSKLEKIL